MLTFTGGITNGQEMVAAYLRAKFPGPTTEVVLALAEVGERGVNYSVGSTGNTLWWLWQILRSAVMGIGRKKKA